MIRIVHLSDFHFSNNNKDFELYCLKPLVNDLIKINEVKEIDLIIFSGDLIDKGGLSFDKDIELAFLSFEELVINPLIEALNIQRDRFIFVPGNHDIDKFADKPMLEVGMEHTLTSVEAINSFIDDNDLTLGANRIKQYKEFERYYYKETEHHIDNFSSTFKFTFNGVKVGISGLNSAWRCWDSDSDNGKLLLGERQVALAIEALNDCDLKIAVVHHPLDWISSIERAQIEHMIQRSYNMLFCGHVHEGGSRYSTSMYGGNLFVSAAPANWSSSIRTNNFNYTNGYAYIDYDFQQIVVYNRSYYHVKGCFDPNPNRGDSEGKSVYGLPTEEQSHFIIKKKDICEAIIAEQISQLDEHLLSYRTNTLAPKSINELFVMPRLTQRLDKNDEKSFTLEEICSSDSNLLLIGAKESGKTILLDKLLVELMDKLYEYNKIPVYIDLNKTINRFETEISRYLIELRIKEVPDFLSSQDVVLLIDNISASPKLKSILIALEKLMIDYPRIRVIATATSMVSADIPMEFRDYSIISNFKPIQINPFKSNQIRSLIEKWFSTNPHFKNEDSLKEVIGIFNKLDIPRTPLAVSMFLCIIEIQPNFSPVNNATLLEHYLEILFEKHAPQEILSEVFDFKNKQRLLAEIAYKMFHDNDLDYRIDRVSLISFIAGYLESRKFYYKADDILNDLEKVGVFKEEIEEGSFYLRFRFNCFFRFFLMKNMEFNLSFKEHVLHEDNYLYFVDEIDYYTGIKRDEEDILFLTNIRMIEKFESLIQSESNLLNLDDIFQNNSLVSDLRDELLANIPVYDKPSRDSLDELADTQLELAPSSYNGVKKIDGELSTYRQLENTWVLVAKVLKNTEETSRGDLKLEVYNKLLKYSATYIALARMMLVKSSDEINLNSDLAMILDFLPTGLHSILSSLISSSKLSVVLEEDLVEKLKNATSYSEIEILLSLFNFIELNIVMSMDYIRDFLRIVKKRYIIDNLTIKLTYLYYTRPSNSRIDNQILNYISEIKTKHTNLAVKNRAKTKIMEEMRDEKIQRMRRGSIDGEIIA